VIWPVAPAVQRKAIAETWSIFPVSQQDPIHLRAISGKGVPNPQPPKNITFTEAVYPCVFDRQQAFEDKAFELNARGYNIYTCFNRIKPDFAGDEHNGLAVKDADILRRRFILIDFDRSNTSQPATEAELDVVQAVAHRAELDLFYSKGHDPIAVCSGNGVHLYLPVDLPNDHPSKALCKQALNDFASKYDTANVGVDTCVYNASRITKVPGTIARKGLEVLDPAGLNDRFYRMAEITK
jgi:hypothetical protein